MKQRHTEKGTHTAGNAVKRKRQQKASTAPPSPILVVLCTIIRMIGTLCFAILATAVVYLAIPLHPFSFVLRAFGIKGAAPVDFATRFWGQGFVKVIAGNPIIEISKKIDVNEPTIMMYSHTSFYDPIFLGGHAPLPAKFIFKKELLYLFPPVFIAAYFAGHIPINRSKRNSAISSLQETARTIKEAHKSIGISPEGTRSPDGTLQPFKKGPFHLAKDAEIKHIMPVVIFGCYELWPVGQFFPTPGTIRLHCLDPVDTSNATLEELSDRVHRAMEVEIERVNKQGLYPKFNPQDSLNIFWAVVSILVTIALCTTLWFLV